LLLKPSVREPKSAHGLISRVIEAVLNEVRVNPSARPGLSGGVFRRAAGARFAMKAWSRTAAHVALAFNPDGEKEVLGL
jgi:hypothetical protein